MSNKHRVDLFIYHALPFRTRKSKNKKDNEQDISRSVVTLSVLGKFYIETSRSEKAWIINCQLCSTKIKSNPGVENLGFDLRFAFRRFEIQRKLGFETWQHNTNLYLKRFKIWLGCDLRSAHHWISTQWNRHDRTRPYKATATTYNRCCITKSEYQIADCICNNNQRCSTGVRQCTRVGLESTLLELGLDLRDYFDLVWDHKNSDWTLP